MRRNDHDPPGNSSAARLRRKDRARALCGAGEALAGRDVARGAGRCARRGRCAGAAAQNAATIEENLEKGIVSQLEYRQVENASLEIQSDLLALAYQQKMAQAEWDRVTGRYFRFSEARGQNMP